MSVAFPLFEDLAGDLVPHSHLEKVNLGRYQLRETSPVSCLLERLNQNSLSQIVPLDAKSFAETTNKFLLPRSIIPHVYKSERRDVHQVIHKTGPIPSPIAPVSQYNSLWQFNEVARVEVTVANYTACQLEPAANGFFCLFQLIVGDTHSDGHSPLSLEREEPTAKIERGSLQALSNRVQGQEPTDVDLLEVLEQLNHF
jgi:hypothetical protein